LFVWLHAVNSASFKRALECATELKTYVAWMATLNVEMVCLPVAVCS